MSLKRETEFLTVPSRLSASLLTSSRKHEQLLRGFLQQQQALIQHVDRARRETSRLRDKFVALIEICLRQ